MQNYTRIFDGLANSEVEYFVTGGLAAPTHGSINMTDGIIAAWELRAAK
jgi:hypothetical protein